MIVQEFGYQTIKVMMEHIPELQPTVKRTKLLYNCASDFTLTSHGSLLVKNQGWSWFPDTIIDEMTLNEIILFLGWFNLKIFWRQRSFRGNEKNY